MDRNKKGKNKFKVSNIQNHRVIIKKIIFININEIL
jgi:hypothetical protein